MPWPPSSRPTRRMRWVLREAAEIFVPPDRPMMPHLAEELWQRWATRRCWRTALAGGRPGADHRRGGHHRGPGQRQAAGTIALPRDADTALAEADGPGLPPSSASWMGAIRARSSSCRTASSNVVSLERMRSPGAAAGILLLAALGSRLRLPAALRHRGRRLTSFDDLETVQIAPLPRPGRTACCTTCCATGSTPRPAARRRTTILRISLERADARPWASARTRPRPAPTCGSRPLQSRRELDSNAVVFVGLSNSTNSYNILESQFATYISEQDARERRPARARRRHPPCLGDLLRHLEGGRRRRPGRRLARSAQVKMTAPRRGLSPRRRAPASRRSCSTARIPAWCASAPGAGPQPVARSRRSVSRRSTSPGEALPTIRPRLADEAPPSA